MKSAVITFSIYALIAIFGLIGWIKNISKLIDCDFEPSYKSEVLRIIGIPVAPVGAVIGYMDLIDVKKPENK